MISYFKKGLYTIVIYTYIKYLIVSVKKENNNLLSIKRNSMIIWLTVFISFILFCVCLISGI